jgi:hypothetical protein
VFSRTAFQGPHKVGTKQWEHVFSTFPHSGCELLAAG